MAWCRPGRPKGLAGPAMKQVLWSRSAPVFGPHSTPAFVFDSRSAKQASRDQQGTHIELRGWTKHRRLRAAVDFAMKGLAMPCAGSGFHDLAQ